MLALNNIGDSFDQPILFFDGIQTASYNAGTGAYHLSAEALSYFTTAPVVEHSFSPFKAILEINLTIDNSGFVVSGTPTPTDMRLAIDTNSNGVIDAGDTLLLSGQIEPATFAFDAAANTEYVFGPTGGIWQSTFFTGKTAGVVLNLINAPDPFDFDSSFSLVTVKGLGGSLGTITPPAQIDIEKYIKGVSQSPGGEGLTPGFWKQPQHFFAWTNYTQSDDYNTVFGVNDPDSPTLLEALQRGGGGYRALGRHAVAALLNAANPNIDYAFTEAQVIALVQQAFATGDYEGIKNILAKENEKGANINDGPIIITPTPGFGDDADSPPGPTFPAGSQVQFTFVVTNPDTTPLANVVVTDNNETPGNPLDDFHPNPVFFDSTTFNIGDDNMDGRLDPGELWLYTWTKVVTPGQHTNTACVVGTPVDAAGNPVGQDVTDCDDANWTTPNPVNTIDIEKFVKEGPNANGGGEGLTPGYWKQPQHFFAWTNYTQTDSFNTVFGVNDPESPTLLGALQRGGGGANALGRHAVAALLNASNPNISYAYTVPQIIAMVQSAYASGNFEPTKDLFAKENEKGANLSNGGGGGTPGFGDDADSPPGVNIPVGNQVTFTYVVTNPGQTQLANVVVVDDNETPGVPGDDYFPTPILEQNTVFNVGDDDQDGRLDPGEVWLYTATKTVTAGQHTTIGKATGTPVDANGQQIGANVSDQDAGNWFGTVAKLGSYVFRDANANGLMDSTETGMGGVTVNLLNSSGTVVATTTTDTSGWYKFNNLNPGSYKAQFVKPNGYKFTAANVGDDMIDSDADVTTGMTGLYTVNGGEDNTSVKAGLISDFQGAAAAPSFWVTTNGQNLIKSLNVLATAKPGTSAALGTWLGKYFPNIYNVTTTSNYFSGKTTAQVAARYVQMYNANPTSADVQVLSLALSIYVSTNTLNMLAPGQAAAVQRGFVLSAETSATNLRNKVWNVGDNGEAFYNTTTVSSGPKKGGGTTTTTVLTSADNQSLTVWTLLQRANACAASGVLWAKPVTIGGIVYTSSTLQTQGKTVLSAINALGTILQ